MTKRVVTWNWDFGDGKPVQNRIPSYMMTEVITVKLAGTSSDNLPEKRQLLLLRDTLHIALVRTAVNGKT